MKKTKIKIKKKTETKLVRTPTWGRFAPLVQAPQLSFPFSFSHFSHLISEIMIISTLIKFRSQGVCGFSHHFPSNMFNYYDSLPVPCSTCTLWRKSEFETDVKSSSKLMSNRVRNRRHIEFETDVKSNSKPASD